MNGRSGFGTGHEVRKKRSGMLAERGLESGIERTGLELVLWHCGVSDLGQPAQ